MTYYTCTCYFWSQSVANVLLIAGDSQTVFVIDEVGKMELFSREFVESVRRLFHCPANVIMATIPVAQRKSHWLVEEIRNRKDCTLFEVHSYNYT